ncbi:hypothetical protein LTR96_011320 [Exophiala xenobiotica]|nr:hypothetical protein LTR72_011106 [Exophiala xenobiotica]KAK5263253.1 hypothetical protein LTR96_011320 [Exophiala xenobiotica]KAK5284975.1 hypothetical protein LTR14_011342 [Exophiala xenobiotica]KAK5332922.1 hypothetical protein LTR98_010972 [Exophiala xenobiotica]KAK5471431.1 hypothetical protein LTR55_010849 [Exophiala xenobiotica]
MAKIGHESEITDSTKQGGLVAAYYFGCLFGAFFGGSIADRYGRKKGVWVGSLFCILGGSLQAGSQNTNMFLCARVIAGLGVGFINSIIPPWISELAKAHERGANFAMIFISNCKSPSLPVQYPDFFMRWPADLLLMFQMPVLIVVCIVYFIPDSPRWLIANGRREEAIDILAKVRGDLAYDDQALVAEVEQLEAVIEASYHKRNRLHNLVLGRYSGRLHLGRRVWLSILLQQMELWTGIMAITTYSGKLMAQAGFSPGKAAWLAGLCNTLGGVLGTAAAIPVIDRLGRVKSFLVGLVLQGTVLVISAAFTKVSEDSADNPARAQAFGIASTCMVFLFLFSFCMFTIIPCWIWSTEIWPQEIRAKAFAFTILGWGVGCGVTTLVIPIMLSRLGWATFLVFACLNVVSFPIVWFFYPETTGRSLEEMNLVFASPSLLVSKNMEEYQRMIDSAGGSVPLAARRLLDEVDAEYSEKDVQAEMAIEEGKAGVHVGQINHVAAESDKNSG